VGQQFSKKVPKSVSETATNYLQDLNVNIKLQTKIISSAQMPNGQEELILSNGEKLVTDLYIPTFGLTPNSSYIPAKFLNAKGLVVVDNYLKVKGAGDVWAIGDVADVDSLQFISCDRESAHLAKNIILLLSNKTPVPYKALTSSMIPFIGCRILTWLTFSSFSWSSNWQEGCNRLLGKYQDSRFYHSLGSEDSIHRELGAHCQWFLVLIILDNHAIWLNQ
jgi:hypothetical protein